MSASTWQDSSCSHSRSQSPQRASAGVTSVSSALLLNVKLLGEPWPVYHWASTLSTYVVSQPLLPTSLKSFSNAAQPRQSNAVETPCDAITLLKPIALSCAHCHSSTVCSMPTSVGPIASLPKPPPPGCDSTATLPSPSSWADAVDEMPLASVTSAVTVSAVSLPRALRVYATAGPSLGGSVVDDEDQRTVYGPEPPVTSIAAAMSSPPRVALTTACGATPSTAGTWRCAWVPVSLDGLHV